VDPAVDWQCSFGKAGKEMQDRQKFGNASDSGGLLIPF